MNAIKKTSRNPFVYSCLAGIVIKMTTEAMSKLIDTIPSTNKLFLGLLNLTVTHHLPDTEIWKTVLGIASWLITTFFLILIAFFAYAVFKVIANIFRPDSDEPPPYEGFTWKICLKSGVYQARINPDYEQEVMFGQFFPLAVTMTNEIRPTAWKLIRRIDDTNSYSK